MMHTASLLPIGTRRRPVPSVRLLARLRGSWTSPNVRVRSRRCSRYNLGLWNLVETIMRLCQRVRRRSSGPNRNDLAGLTEDASDDGWIVVGKKPKNQKIGCPLLKGSNVLDFKAPAKNEDCSVVSNVKQWEKIKDGSVPSGVFRAPACKSGTKKVLCF